ncbi:monovalent cation/H(+) antiporter subunit G [Aquisalimonas sp. 2447]|uniref:monovalent cation/H(+) antiporter subunit G n=1 Tax=Aquisalimonas sp. 2447 TaxID=2740807 RepID=UPI0014325925|nr:monovalent cation/H(+) antiporter subunit G [Aquisalimonas sp. 2447]QIT54810.1 monovalent cation/H(+) antiporter subunit G [Aquisalimonas sp. 2447]
MSEVLTAIMLLAGALLILIGAIGAVRMPDLLLRMHATTKAGALGAGLIAVGSGIYFTSPEVSVRAVAILAFVVLTAPVAAHMIGRAGYFTGAPLWQKTLKDELRDNLDRRGHYLHSGSPPEQTDDDDSQRQ